MRLFISSLNAQSGDSPIVPNPTTIVNFDSSRWVAGARGDVYVSLSSNLIETSVDGGLTYTNSISFADADQIQGTWVYPNGNIVFALRDRSLYFTDKNLTSVIEKTMKDTDGSDFVLHTPVVSWYQGTYFIPAQYGSYHPSLVISGNYANTYYGAAPGLMWYSDDNGETLKIAYEFGQNPNYRDDGTISGGTTGTLLGNPNSDIIIRKTRNIAYCEFNDKWYCNTSDFNDFGIYGEFVWMEGTYTNGVWNWNLIDFGFHIPRDSYLQAGGIFFREIGGEIYIYWGNKTGYTTASSEGIWRSKLSEFSDTSKHENVLKFGRYMRINFLHADHKTGIVAGIAGEDGSEAINLVILLDYGHGSHDIKGYPERVFRGVTPINNDGNITYRIDTDFYEPLQSETLFFKPGLDLFNNV